MSDTPLDDLLTVQDAARFLRVSAITVRRYVAAGRLSAIRVGRAVRIRRGALERFMIPVVPPAGEIHSVSGGGVVAETPTAYAGEATSAEGRTAMWEYMARNEGGARRGGSAGSTVMFPRDTQASMRLALAEARALRDEIRKTTGVLDVVALLDESRQGQR